jgi:hypothetical protein
MPPQTTLTSSIEFTNVTASAGIKFVHFKGNQGISINREEFGPGVCVSDFDGDGWQDIYFVNGRDLYNRDIFIATTATVPSPTSPTRPESRAPAMAWGVSGETMTMTAFPTCLLPSMAATFSTTTTATGLLAM